MLSFGGCRIRNYVIRSNRFLKTCLRLSAHLRKKRISPKEWRQDWSVIIIIFISHSKNGRFFSIKIFYYMKSSWADRRWSEPLYGLTLNDVAKINNNTQPLLALGCLTGVAFSSHGVFLNILFLWNQKHINFDDEIFLPALGNELGSNKLDAGVRLQRDVEVSIPGLPRDDVAGRPRLEKV